MLNHPTITKLNQMRLQAMANAFANQLQNPKFAALSFEERLGMLVDHEWQSRHSRKTERLIKQAALRFPSATIEDIDWNPRRQLDQSQILSLSNCTWIGQNLNVIIDGKSGVGKTWLACALGNAACRQGITVYSIRLSKLLTNLTLARGDGSYNTLMNKIKKIPMLILVDWLLNPLDAAQCREVLEVLEERYDRCATIFSSQWSAEDWYSRLGEPTLADAILDRCIHNAYRIHIDGDTKRRKS